MTLYLGFILTVCTVCKGAVRSCFRAVIFLILYLFVGSSLLVCQMYNSTIKKGFRQIIVMLDLELFMSLTNVYLNAAKLVEKIINDE